MVGSAERRGRLYELLDPAAVGVLRGGYDEPEMFALCVPGVTRFDEAVTPWVKWLEDEVFDPEVMPPAERERVLVGLFASRGQALPMAIHAYWGLGAGLETRDLVTTLMLIGNYSGMSTYYTAAMSLERLYEVLADRVREGDVTQAAVLEAIVAAFR